MRSQVARRKLTATDARNLRTLLLLSVFAPEDIGARIAQARREAGLTQEELADLVGVSTRSFQGYESGAVVPYKHLGKISEIVRRPVPWFLHGDEATETATPDADTLRLLVREEVEAALVQVESLLGQLLHREPPESPADGLEG